MRKKRILLSLGTISAVAPIFATVACGINQYPTSEEQKIYNELTSTTALKIWENQWQKKVIDTMTKDDKKKLIKEFTLEGGKEVWAPNLENEIVTDIAQGMIQNGINNDQGYLGKMATDMMNSGVKKLGKQVPGLDPTDKDKNVYTQIWLNENGILANTQNSYNWKYEPKGQTPHVAGALTYKGLQLLASDNRLNFKTELLKSLMVYTYLDKVNKEKWASVNASESLNLKPYETAIDPTIFPLVKEAIDKKYFGKWEIKLSASDSRPFSNNKDQTKVTPAEALKHISLNNKDDLNYLVNKTKYSERKTRVTDKIYNFNDNGSIDFDPSKLDIPVPYKGIVSQSAGNGILKFDEASLKSITSRADYEGFLVNKDFIKYDAASTNKSIALFKEKSSEASLTLVSGIMPIFTNDLLSFKDDATKDKMKKFFAIYDKDLYADAKKYFLTEVKDKPGKKTKNNEAWIPGIVLKFNDEPVVKKYQTILEDMGADYFEVKEPE